MLVILSSQQTETPKTSNSEPYTSLEDVTREEYAADLRSRENHKATNSDKNRESFLDVYYVIPVIHFENLHHLSQCQKQIIHNKYNKN